MLPIDKILLKKIYYEKKAREKIESEGRRDKEPNLLSISNALDEYYYLNKIQLYCAYLSYKKFVNPTVLSYNKNDIRLIHIILNQIDDNYFDNPAIKVYNKIRLLYEALNETNSNDKTIYLELKSLIDEYEYTINRFDKATILSYLTNYCLYKMNNGNFRFREEFLYTNLSILKSLYTKNTSKKNKLPPSTFKNIVVVSLKLDPATDFFQRCQITDKPAQAIRNQNKHNWIEEFMEYYKKWIDTKYKKTYYNYCLALLLFEKMEYVKAYRVLQNPSRTQGMFINLDTKVLHLVILYEVFNKRSIILENDGIDILKVLDSLRGLLKDDLNRKKQVSQKYVAIYKNFEKTYKRLYNLNLRYGGMQNKPLKFEKEQKKLKANVHAIEIPFKNWILDKIHRL
ncbi:MAG: hypothetical protein AAFZ15_13725 [Bacteroidota bacterium]